MNEVRAALDDAADPDVARGLRRYLQVRPGGYGEGEEFIGVKLSTVRRIVAPYSRCPFSETDWIDLLRSPVHEYRLAALVIMSERAGRGTDVERESIFRTYLSNIEVIDNWDLVDVSAAPVVGGWLLDRDRALLYRWADSTSRWKRRIAVVSTHRFIRAGQDADTYRLAEQLLDERDDLVQKAIGWMLRECGQRVSADDLRAFLDVTAARLPRTTLRYAIEHFPPEERIHYQVQRPGTSTRLNTTEGRNLIMPDRPHLIPGPDHPITVTQPADQRVQVHAAGEAIADSTRALALAEADYPVAYYLPMADVNTALLEPTSTETYCPFKGDASYWSVVGREGRVEDAVWGYQTPYPAVAQIADHVAFYPDRVEIVVGPV